MGKIGVGIVTFNRPQMYYRCVDSIPAHINNYTVITGDKYNNEDLVKHNLNTLYICDTPTCVGKGKNILFNLMLKDNIEHIFIVEDDMLIKDPTVFDKYIEVSEVTGIRHFNYGYHGPVNKKDGKPFVKANIKYSDRVTLALNHHCVGAFSYYHRSVIDKIGFMDETFVNCMDHVEHTYRISQASLTTPFWWFADIKDSFNYIEDQDADLKNSVIRHEGQEVANNTIEGVKYFIQKHKVSPFQIPAVGIEQMPAVLKMIRVTNTM